MMLSFYTFRVLAAICKHVFTWMFLCGSCFSLYSIASVMKGKKTKVNDLMSEECKRTPETLKISFFSVSYQYIKGHLEAAD